MDKYGPHPTAERDERRPRMVPRMDFTLQGSDEDADVPELSLALDKLHQTAEKMAQVIGSLGMRLQPILLEDAEAVPEDANKPAKAVRCSEVTNSVLSAESQYYKCYMRLTNLLDRLDV